MSDGYLPTEPVVQGFRAGVAQKAGERRGGRREREGSLRVRVPPPASRAGVAQTADAPPSEGGACEFESHLPHQTQGARSPNRQRPRAQTTPSESSNLSARMKLSVRGCMQNGERGLIFNQAPEGLCGFESRHPCQRLSHLLPETFTLAVAQTRQSAAP